MGETFAIAVNGTIVHKNIPSRTLAESLMMSLPADQRTMAEIVPMTNSGKKILFG